MDRIFIHINRYRYPFFTLLICVAAYGVFIPWLGFYWDDWQYIFPIASNRFSDLPLIFSNNRPLAHWTIKLSAPFLGFAPVKWQVSTLLIRWASALSMYWALSFIWPTKIKDNWLMATLYAVYPIFFWQPASVTFSQHFISFLLYFLSLGAMGWLINNKKFAIPITMLALLSELLHLITVEYIVGLELLRPLYIFWMLAQTPESTRTKVGKVIRIWLPYGILLSVFSYWRVFLAELERNAIVLGSAQELVNTIVKSYIHVLWDTWASALNGINGSFADRFTLISLAIGISVFLIFMLFVTKQADPAHFDGSDRHWQKQGVLLGLMAIFLGLVPIWLIGKSPLTIGLAADRFSIPALFGASVFVISLITYLVPNNRRRDFVIALLLLISVVNHANSGNAFRRSWKAQENFYSQLLWRAPDIEPDTALFTYGKISGRMNENTTAFAINTIYPQSQGSEHLDYWIYDLEIGESEWDFSSLEGDQLRGSAVDMEAGAKYPEDILLFYQPESGCIWVLTPLDENNNYIPIELRELAQFSNIDRIYPLARDENYSRMRSFETSNSLSWCYFYQKAALAQQLGNWEKVIDLMDEANTNGLSPNNQIELIPLIEAYANMGNWQLALDISDFDKNHVKTRILFCALWGKMSDDPKVTIPLEITDEIMSRPDCD